MRQARDTTDAVQLRILAFMEAEGLSADRLAKRAGVAEGALRDVKSPTWRPTFATVRKVEAVIPADFETPKDFCGPSHAAPLDEVDRSASRRRSWTGPDRRRPAASTVSVEA